MPRVPKAAGRMYSAIESSEVKTRSSASEGVARAALGDPDVRKAIDAAGGSVPPPMSLAEAAHFYAADAARLQALATAARIEPL